MDWIYLGMVIFLFVLATFDLWVGVSNDAVNFLNSAIGSKVAKFRTIIVIAAIGVFFGATLSDGMMDVARHGIFNPQYFTFGEVMIIFLAVMVTDVVLLDIFNSLGMPTSSTVSLVFELLGGAFAFCLIKISAGGDLTMGDYMNTEKALTMIIAIFLSVAVAFFFGSVVQYLSRLLFTFHYNNKNLRWKVGLFGGLAITAIVYFMFFKGLSHISFMTNEAKDYIDNNIWVILIGCFLFFSILMQILHACRVNVFKIVVLTGTFALAMAFAGNDLVNFIGVPLAGYSSYTDFMANGGGVDPYSFKMTSLLDSAQTSFYFLFGAGAIMVFSLAASKKARNVVKTEVNLARSNEGEEMFGSSRMARSIVRFSNGLATSVSSMTPRTIRRFIESRFNPPAEVQENGAAYDLIRASVNLVVASLLIALGTSLKLPLSTTYVTFMVSMGTSLADRAWSRESAVFRITGVLTVIGGWFITAGVAFTACFFVTLAMRYGGSVVICLFVIGVVYSLYHSQMTYNKKQRVNKGDTLFLKIASCNDKQAILPMLETHMGLNASELVDKYCNWFCESTDGLFAESMKTLRSSRNAIKGGKKELKSLRRRETICLRRCDGAEAVMLSTPFHMVHNSLQQVYYNILRMNESMCEHVDNNFMPIDSINAQRYCQLRDRLAEIMEETSTRLRNGDNFNDKQLQGQCIDLEESLNTYISDIMVEVQVGQKNLNAMTLLLHVVQETEQMVVNIDSFLNYYDRFRFSSKRGDLQEQDA